MPRYTALLDACVLVPMALADTLRRVAERELYRPLWSERILDEAADAILEIHPDDFLLDQLGLAPRVVLDVLCEQAAHTRKPPLTPTDLLARLARAGVPAFADEAGRMI